MTSEIEEAVARVEGEAASLEAWSKTVHASLAERARHRRNAADLRTILSALSASQAEVERLGRERDALKLQAQCWAMEARGQKATVQEAYQAVTGATGEPGNWNGAVPIRSALQAAEARATRAEGLLEEAGEVLGPFAQKLDDIGDDEADDDAFREMSPEHRRAPRITVGHLRAARAFLAKLKGETQ